MILQNQASVHTQLVASYYVKCSCSRNTNQIYYCSDENCEDHKQRYFCLDCSVQVKKPHLDKNPIKDEHLKKWMEWLTIFEKVQSLKKIIDGNYHQYQQLKQEDQSKIINWPDKNLSHNVDEDVQTFNQKYEEIKKKIDEVQTLFFDKQHAKMLQNIPCLIEFQKFYKKVEYLTQLNDIIKHENPLNEVQKPIFQLEVASSRKIDKFSPEIHDTFERQKSRWITSQFEDINSQFKKQNQLIEEQKQQQLQAQAIAFQDLNKQLQAQLNALETKINRQMSSSLGKLIFICLVLIGVGLAIFFYLSGLNEMFASITKSCHTQKFDHLQFNTTGISDQLQQVNSQLKQNEKKISTLNTTFGQWISNLNSTFSKQLLAESTKLSNQVLEQITNQKQNITQIQKDVQLKVTQIQGIKSEVAEVKRITDDLDTKKDPLPNDQRLKLLSSIVDSKQALKIISYFPEAKRNFKIYRIYKGSTDGWTQAIFQQKVLNQGPTLIILKTTDSAIAGGYTSQNWQNGGGYRRDIDAFVFNMKQKYTPNNYDKAIDTRSNGFEFGNYILRVSGDPLNAPNYGLCYTGKATYYDIEGDVSPLTNQKDQFTCAELEVYKVVY